MPGGVGIVNDQVVTGIEDCAKDGSDEFLPRCIAFELQIFTDSIGIRLKNAVHLGKKILAAIFSAIVYRQDPLTLYAYTSDLS